MFEGELKKISYPTKSETIGSTTVVLLFCVIYVFIFVGSGFVSRVVNQQDCLTEEERDS